MDSATDAKALDARPGTEDNDLPTSGPAQAVPSRRAAILRSAFVLGVLFVVFVLILPQFVDYGDVVDAFRDLTLTQVALMTGLAVIAWLISGLPFVTLIPGLSVAQGMASWLTLGGIGASIPLGPWNMAILWVVVRGWGVPIKAATSGIGLYGVINQLARLATPLMAVVVIAVSGSMGGASGAAVVLIVISTIVLIVATGLMLAIVRSDRAADWLGRTGQQAASWALARLGRSEQPDLDNAIHRFRDQVGDVVRERGRAGLLAALLVQITWCVMLIAALRIVGVDDRVLAVADIFAVYAAVSVITIVPISPGGAGVPELLYIAGLSAIAGSSYESTITAGVFLFRLYQWFLPIPIAWALLKVARHGKPMLPTTAELRMYARDDAAPVAVPS
ncbi:MAG TPA: lysylphosphatidylglycerol synthase domain-containing protein [Candidatus Limnocylindrales bacterium]|nr:lysylphosphatidylglycerol synthase domain-containing protein [Candidatus Limnocylindrales bacterium]